MASTRSVARNQIKKLQGVAESTRPLRILVLDDDQMFGKILERAARRKGVELTTCTSTVMFLDKIKSSHFDVAVIDFYLHGLNGVEVARGVRNQPVIMISSSRRWADKVSDWPRSVRAFLSKETGASDLLDGIIQYGQRSPSRRSFYL